MMDAPPTHDRCVLMLGGFDAGKSNFLFRLWLAIEEDKCALRKNGLPDDLEYLRKGARSLMSGSYAEHTPTTVRDISPIPISYVTREEEWHGVLVVPDCAGEEWMAVYKKREWPTDWASLIDNRCVCLLFVRVDSEHVHAALDWISCMQLFGRPAEQVAAEKGETPTQVVLVDWIQALRRIYTQSVGGGFRPRIGIVISAWDRIPNDRQDNSPEVYLDTEFPLLGQFIESNADRFEFRVFGVSTTGGDLKTDPEFKKQYQERGPLAFGYVVHSLEGRVVKSNDITLPVAWALGCQTTGATP